MKRRAPHEGGGSEHEGEGGAAGHERWTISYADFMTLLFAFFVVLYAISQKDAEKAKQFQESIKKYLIQVKGGGGGGAQGATTGSGAGQSPPSTATNVEERADVAVERPFPKSPGQRPESAYVLDEAEAFVESQMTRAEREKYVLDLSADDWGVRIIVPSNAIFARGSEKFLPEAMPFVTKLTALVNQLNRKILIAGHVAENETGHFKTTWEFASARALNFLRFMQAKEHMDSTRLAAVSLADSRPLFSHDTHAKNSRIEVVVLNPDFEF